MRRAKIAALVLFPLIFLLSTIGPFVLFFCDEAISKSHWLTFKILRFLRGSLNLGGGNCEWQPPEDVPIESQESFYKLLIAGFPSGNKQLIFIQMEALTGLLAKNEWDFA